MIWLVIAAGWVFPFRLRIDLSFLLAQITVPVTPVQPIINAIPPMADTEDIVNVPTTIPLWWVLVAIWILGTVCVVVYHALRHGRFMKMVRRWSESVTDLESLGILDSLKSELGIKTQVRLSVCQSISSPMLVGFFHPVILLPPIKIPGDELSLILKHELIHFQRHDLWYKALILAATTIHWFNPVVYLMAKATAVQCEISCDALVLLGADFQQRKQYGETIIGVVRNGARLRTALSSNFYGGKKVMKNRISSIMDTKRKKAGFVILCVVLVAIIGTGVTLAATNKEANTVDNKPEIFENVNNQLDSDIEFTNGWRSALVEPDDNGGTFIIVQVGSLKNDPEQGVAVVCHHYKNSDQYVIDDKFLTPSKHGTIKVESLGAKDFNMTVVAGDGYRWIFSIYNGFYNNGEDNSIASGGITTNNQTGLISADGGQTWMGKEEYQKLYPTFDIVWWTYDEYKEWLEQEKIHLQQIVNAPGWSQERIDNAVQRYEQQLEDIKNGARYSKSIEGFDGTVAMGSNITDSTAVTYEEQRVLNLSVPPSVRYNAVISLENGEAKDLGSYATKEECFDAVKVFCDEQVKAGKLTQQEADGILGEFK